jgi:hypothetical protein
MLQSVARMDRMKEDVILKNNRQSHADLGILIFFADYFNTT